MGYEELSPIAPARVRCLLLPCGKISLTRFLEFAQVLQKEKTVRLSDVKQEPTSKKGMFSPDTFPAGSILLDYSTSDVPTSSRYLVPFELYRLPLLIIGIADGLGAQVQQEPLDGQSTVNEHSDISHNFELEDRLEGLKESYHSALLHKIIVFDGSTRVGQLGDSIICLPSPDQLEATSMKTIMCSFIGQFLEELSSYAKSIQALPNIETPAPRSQAKIEAYLSRPGSRTQSPRPGTGLSGTSSPPVLSRDGLRSPYRASLPAHVLSPLATETPNGEAPSSTSSSPVGGHRPATTFEEISADRPSSASSVDHNSGMNRVSVHGFGSNTTGERARNQARGRLGVVVGSMYLLAGRWSDATKELTESATTAKWSNDHAWYAKALDYILVSLLMCGWAGLDFEVPQICYPGEKPPWSITRSAKQEGIAVNRIVSLKNLCQLLPDLVNHILYFYSRAATSSFSDKIPLLSFSESAIRFAKLLSIVRASYGMLNDQCLNSITSNIIPPSSGEPDNVEAFPNRYEIASVALRAVPATEPDDFIDVFDRVGVLAGIASVLASLDYHRKKAFILRELVTILLPALIQSRKDNAAELGLHPAASLSTSDLISGSLEGSSVSFQYGEDKGGIQSLLDLLCEVYGTVNQGSQLKNLPIPGESGSHVQPGDMNALLIERITSQSIRRAFGNIILKLDVLRWCVNICEALPDLPSMLRFSGNLLATAASGIAPGPESSDAYPRMPADDQLRLVNTISRAAGATQQLAISHSEADYWDEFLVRDIEVLSPSVSDLPIARRKNELQLIGMAETKKKAGPFIYNPFATKPEVVTREPTLLLDDEATFLILVQNLCDVDLELEWLKLDATDAGVDSLSRNLTIGPYRTQKVYLKGRPRILGPLVIHGCVVKAKGCKARFFPIFRSAWKFSEDSKIKVIGLAASSQPPDRPLSISSDLSRNLIQQPIRPPFPSSIAVNVIKDQPVVLLKSTTLTQSAIMVLLGQKRTFLVELQNTSTDLIDLLLVSFTDSTSDLLHAAVENKDLSPSDLYEAEVSAYSNPAFRLLHNSSKEDLFIAPGGNLTLEVEVLGKPGLNYGTMQISYAHLGVPKSEVQDRFYTRQIVVPIAVTVNASVDLVRTEILPFTGEFAWRNMQKQSTLSADILSPTDSSQIDHTNHHRFQKLFSKLGRGLQVEEHCLLLLDFHNAWPKPLTISLEIGDRAARDKLSDSWNLAYSVYETVQPGHSTRMLVIIPKIVIENPHASIPAINPANKRQFVLSTSKVSAELEKTGREMFWYREQLLRNVRATWQEQGGRVGEVNLRNLRLTPRMVEILKPDAIEIEVKLISSEAEQDHVRQIGRLHFDACADAFATVSVRVVNRGAQPLYPLLRIQPSLRHQPYNVALDLSRKIAFNGLLQRALPLLQAKESREVKLGIVFLCAGEYEIGACVEELKLWRPEGVAKVKDEKARSRAGTGDFLLSELENNERRIWYAKGPCLINVYGASSLGEARD